MSSAEFPEIVQVEDGCTAASGPDETAASVTPNNDDIAKEANFGQDSTPNESNTLRQRLAVVIEEKKAISSQLALIFQREIDTSLSNADALICAKETGQNATLAALEESLQREKLLFEETLSLKRQLAAVQIQLDEKKRLENEFARVKEYWKGLSRLLPVGPELPSGWNPGERRAIAASRASDQFVDESAASDRLSGRGAVWAGQNMELRREKEQLNQRIVSIRNQSAIDVSRAQREIIFLKGENDKLMPLRQENLRLKAENARLVNEMDMTAQHSGNEMNRLELENKKLAADETRAKEVAQQLEAEVARLKKELSMSSQQAEKVASEQNDHRADYDTMKEERCHLVLQVTAMIDKNCQLEEANETLRKETDALRAEYEKIAKKASDSEQRSKELIAALKKIATDFSQLKAENDDINKTWRLLTDDISSIFGIASSPRIPDWATDLTKRLTSCVLHSKEPEGEHCGGVIVPKEAKKEKEDWQEKYEDLRRKIVEAKLRSTGSNTEPNQDDIVGPTVTKENTTATTTEKDNATNQNSPAMKTIEKENSLKRKATVKILREIVRTKGVMWEKLQGVSTPNAVYSAADSVWGTISGMVQAVAQENIQLRSQLRCLHRCAVAAKRRRSSKKSSGTGNDAKRCKK